MDYSKFNEKISNKDEVSTFLADKTFDKFKEDFFKCLSVKASLDPSRAKYALYVHRDIFQLRHDPVYCQILKDKLELYLKANGWSVHIKECEDRRDPSFHIYLRKKSPFNDFLFKMHDTFSKYEVI